MRRLIECLSMGLRGWTIAVAILAWVPSSLEGQACAFVGDGAESSGWFTVSTVQWKGDRGFDASALEIGVELSRANPRWGTVGTLRRGATSASGTYLLTSAASVAGALPIRATPCVGVGFEGSLARGLNGGDRFLNISLPLSLGLRRELIGSRLAIHADGRLVFSRTSAALFAFRYREVTVGMGGEVGALLRTGPGRVRVGVSRASLDPDLGPHTAGGMRVTLGVGVAF